MVRTPKHHSTPQRRRTARLATLGLLFALLFTIAIGLSGATAIASCPSGLTPVRSIQWYGVGSQGLVETLFELVGRVEPFGGRSRWRSILQSEDGRIRMIDDLACQDGRLLLIAHEDRSRGLRLVLDDGIPLLLDRSAVTSIVITGLAHLSRPSTGEDRAAFYRAEVQAAPPGLIETAAGELLATLTTVRLLVIDPSKVVLLDAELQIWWTAGAERFPARVHTATTIPETGSTTLELIDSRVPRLTPIAPLRYIESPESR